MKRLVFLLLGASLGACGDDTTATGGAGGQGGAGGAGGGEACPITVETRAEDDAETAPIHTPRWAFRPWISKDISTGEDTRAFVGGCLDRDIPVGVVVLDSPWETNYNTYVPNPDRYPEFGDMVSDLRDLDVRVVLWTTAYINASSRDLEPTGDLYDGPSPDWEPARACGYYVNDGRTSDWWKGQGSSIDFFDPEARAFWHRLYDPLLDMGIAGFKLDFGENYLSEIPVRTDDGEKTLQEYSEAYYEDFYRYGTARLGPDEFVTMVRPYDESYQFEGRFFARPEHAPVAWVGDNRRDYVGMRDALDHIFRSALAGYVVVGSDLGGYLDRDDIDLTQMIPVDSSAFVRWTALSSLTPFMQLHGRANLEPWSYPEDTEQVLETYRYWAKLHDELVPFFDSVATAAYEGGDTRMIAPIEEEPDAWPGDFRYVLGGAFLVAPVTEDVATRDVQLPDDARYFDLFDATGAPIDAGTLLTDVDVSDPGRIPVYVREGAIVPMEVGDALTGFGTTASLGALTLLVFPAAEGSTFDVVAEDDSIELSVDASVSAGAVSVETSAPVRTLILRVRVDAAPLAVENDGAALTSHPDRDAFDGADEGWLVDGGFVWVKVAAGSPVALTLE